MTNRADVLLRYFQGEIRNIRNVVDQGKKLRNVGIEALRGDFDDK